jgi:hypothetical protein
MAKARKAPARKAAGRYEATEVLPAKNILNLKRAKRSDKRKTPTQVFKPSPAWAAVVDRVAQPVRRAQDKVRVCITSTGLEWRGGTRRIALDETLRRIFRNSRVEAGPKKGDDPGPSTKWLPLTKAIRKNLIA